MARECPKPSKGMAQLQMAISMELLTSNLSILVVGLALLALGGVVLQRLLKMAVQAVGRLSLDDQRRLFGPERTDEIVAYLTRLVYLVFGITAVAAIAAAIYLTFAGINVAEQILYRLQVLTWADLAPVGVLLLQFIALLVLLRLGGWLGRLFSEWVVVRLKAAAKVRVEDQRIERIGRRMVAALRALLWYCGAMVAIYLLGIPETGAHSLLVVFEIIVVYCLVSLIALALSVAVDAIYEGLVQYWDEQSDALWESRHQISSLSDRIKTALQWAVYIAALTYLASRITFGGYTIGERTLEGILYDLAAAAAKVIAIWIAAMLLVEISALLVHRLSLKPDADGIVPKRRQTVVPLLSSVVRYAVYFIAAVMALNSLGVDTTAILAGAGIAGLAIGFGAQNLIRDLVSGFFILFEGYFWVGDWVDTGQHRGVVESITLRSTWIRDVDGMLHIIPNGEVQALSNYSRDFVRAVVDVGVSYEGDLEKAINVSRETLRNLEYDSDDVTGPPDIRVIDFGGSAVGLRLWLRVKPGMHLKVASEMRRRIKAAYHENGVEIPFARQVVIFEQADGQQVNEIPIRIVGDRPGPSNLG